MSTIIEAFGAAKLGKRVFLEGAEALHCTGGLVWANNNNEHICFSEGTMDGWAIQEPALEYVDFPVIFNEWEFTEGYNRRGYIVNDEFIILSKTLEARSFLGYVFIDTDGKKMISNCPFLITKQDSTQTYNWLEEKIVSGIVWCDFVRFEKSKS